MALILKQCFTGAKYLLELEDPRLKNCPIFSLPFVLCALATYLYFANNIAHRWMENRPPYNIIRVVKYYNIFQVLVNSAIVLLSIRTLWKKNRFCQPLEAKDDEDLMLMRLCVAYYIVKYLDLLDTLFFTMRKKFNQVSFLHVYHHTGTLLMAYIGCKWYPGGHAFYLAPINCFVHIIMYLYYFLSATDSYKKQAVTWKKFITQVQLVQHFMLLSLFTLPLISSSCYAPKIFVFLMVPQCLLMILLFGEFYIKTYVKTSRKKI